MRRTALRGHALRGEGAAYIPGEEEPWLRCRGHIGRGLCECGAFSDVEWTHADRKRWHARHKDEIRTEEKTDA
jgi:hypothetical protein